MTTTRRWSSRKASGAATGSRCARRGRRPAATAHLTRVGDAQLPRRHAGVRIADSTLSIAVHVVYRVSREGDALTVSALDYEAARRALPKRLGIDAVVDERQNVVVTAGTTRSPAVDRRKGGGMFAAGSPLRRVQAGCVPASARRRTFPTMALRQLRADSIADGTL